MYLAEIILAIEDLHRRNIIFRDLKPDNIVFDADGHALITDFGLSKVGINVADQAQSFCGSPAYLSPEMLRRQGHGKPVDWYLVGVLLYEMLVGMPPYYNNNKDILYQNIQQGTLIMHRRVSPEARSLIIALLHRNPAKRLGSGPDDAEELKAHPFFSKVNFNWQQAIERKLPVPPIQIKRVIEQQIPFDNVYGKDSMDKTKRNVDRIQEWSYIRK